MNTTVSIIFGITCLICYLVMLYNAEKIRNSKSWLFWWVLSLFLLAQSIPLFAILFNGVTDEQVEKAIPYMFLVFIVLMLTLFYFNYLRPMNEIRKKLRILEDKYKKLQGEDNG